MTAVSSLSNKRSGQACQELNAQYAGITLLGDYERVWYVTNEGAYRVADLNVVSFSAPQHAEIA